MESKKLPDEFVRGIANNQFIENGVVTYQAFQFDDNPERTDSMKEASINWVDQDEAVQLALNQKKANGELQFRAGVAKLKMGEVKMILKSIPPEVYGFERAALEDNPYHGNILISNSATKPIRMMVQSGLALAAGTNIVSLEE